ncbi:unnamed protein product [Prorocentrum cordatum]|uniref:Uncharacterized protein n=1 Tax=Prorocentrum cordatum TaxID=2364126 RepID=A0ABN9RQE3_9DINO|nr:unnamed protein product [Polarella glacialis]
MARRLARKASRANVASSRAPASPAQAAGPRGASLAARPAHPSSTGSLGASPPSPSESEVLAGLAARSGLEGQRVEGVPPEQLPSEVPVGDEHSAEPLESAALQERTASRRRCLLL